MCVFPNTINCFNFCGRRGSGHNGAAYKMANYRNLGTYEVDATIKIMHLLQKSYDVIDPKRIGIYGWSFGGYFTLSALTR